jgi:hypothetical protein
LRSKAVLGETAQQSAVVDGDGPVPPDQALDPPAKTILPLLLKPKDSLSLDGIDAFRDSILHLAIELSNQASPIEVDHPDQPVRIRVGNL